jgi:putative Mn2+ efflux pump MntP
MILAALFVLFATVQNIDNLVVAVAYGLKNVHISLKSNFLIAALSVIATGLALISAIVLRSEAVELGFKPVTDVVGRGILLMLGVWTLVGCFRSKLFWQLSNMESDWPNQDGISRAAGEMTTAEAAVAGVALAVDNLAPSFAFGLIDLIRQSPFVSGLFLTALTGIFSILAVAQGQFLGRKGYAQCRRFFPKILRPELISGLLFIGIAILPFDIDDWAADFLTPQTEHIEK